MSNQAISDPKKQLHGAHLNILKAQQIEFVIDLKAGDTSKVRTDNPATFKKEIEIQLSDEIHSVQPATR